MSSNTKTVDLTNGKKLIIYFREDGDVSQVDVFIGDEKLPFTTDRYPVSGTKEETAIRKHGIVDDESAYPQEEQSTLLERMDYYGGGSVEFTDE